MHIIEKYIQGKRNDPKLCEDGYVVSPYFAAVIDGSTSKRMQCPDNPDTLYAGKSGGRLAMELTAEVLKHLPETTSLPMLLSAISEQLRKNEPEGARIHPEQRLTCSAAIYSCHHREVWMVGDCQCRIDGKTIHPTKKVDTVLTQIRSEAIHYLLRHGHTTEELRKHDLGRDFIYNALREQCAFQNDTDPQNPFRYTVLDGSPVNENAVRIIPVPERHKLILATDGYPLLKDTLADTEAELQRLLTTDPLCIGENAGTKAWTEGNTSFDDRTYLSIET